MDDMQYIFAWELIYENGIKGLKLYAQDSREHLNLHIVSFLLLKSTSKKDNLVWI